MEEEEKDDEGVAEEQAARAGRHEAWALALAWGDLIGSFDGPSQLFSPSQLGARDPTVSPAQIRMRPRILYEELLLLSMYRG